MPRTIPHRAPAAVAAAVVLALAACGGGAGTSTPASGTAARGSPQLTGSLVVFAAASLTEAFNDGAHMLEANNPGFTATFSFAGSQQLVVSVRNGAPADVIATADMATMQTLVVAGLVDAPQTFAHNTLEIAVARGNPKGIRTLADLADPGVSVVLADATVPAGRFARQSLQKAGVTVSPKSNELDVRSTLQKVESGDADAAIVYSTDVLAAADRVDGVVIPDGLNVSAAYPIAVLRATLHPAAAAAFVREAVSGDVQQALLRRGFRAP